MTKINIITPPDILHNQNDTFLLIYPSEELRSDFQTFLEKCDKPLNVYLYAPEVEEEKDIAWLLAIARIANHTIFDVDNTELDTLKFASYLISLPNTFYLTKDDVTAYNKLSLNRIYDLEWLHTIKKDNDAKQ
jgi:hypothetical protein|tara:strand:+ start:1974 stop:2372 length:399 start_codon:yes stop_codon:yes gene_type:complete